MTRRRPSLPGILILALAVGVALAMALPVGLRQHVGDDFHVFWQAGRNFATGAPLYHDSLPGARPLKYPPFAALVFTPLAMFSLPVAGVVMSVLNLALWVAAAVLTRDIVARTSPAGGAGRWPLVLAFILSAQYFLDNFHHVQMNEVTLVLALLGIRAYLDGKDVGSAAAFVTATALKITPVFFVAWLVIRGRRRAALAVVPLALAVVLVPLILRGPSRGTSELVEYYHVFLQKHQEGDLDTAGQNVAGLVTRMTQPADSAAESYRWLPVDGRTAQRIYHGVWAAILLVFLARLIQLRARGAPVSALEYAMVFLTALLLSPITFTTHLVPLLFILTAVLSSRPVLGSVPRRLLAAVVGLGVLVCGLSGRDLIGGSAYHAVGGYSVCAWTMLALFVFTVVGRPWSPPEPPPSAPSSTRAALRPRVPIPRRLA